MSVEHLSALPPGFNLQEYRIDRILGYGGFGITYLATDTNLDKSVAIKEYLPNELAVRTDGSTVKAKTRDDQDDFRWGLERFLDEARTLARFRHLNLVPVHRFFEAHGTAYMVMEYEPGESLADILKRATERAPEPEVRQMLAGVLSGLEAVHAAGFLHRDIKPSNIIIRPDGTPVLIDFGAARQAVGRRSRNITSIVTPGYAPLEQYTVEGNQGPWTDIYATGAVLYQILTGNAPPDATARARNDPYKPLGLRTDTAYSQQLREAVDWALRFDEADRPQTIAQWRDGLNGAIAIPALSVNDQATRLVSSDRQTVANPSAGRPGARHSVLDNAAPGAAGMSGPVTAGQTRVFSPSGASAAARSNRAVIVAAVLGAVAVVAVGGAALLLLGKNDDPTKIAGVTPTPPTPAPSPSVTPTPKPGPSAGPTPGVTPSPTPAPIPLPRPAPATPLGPLITPTPAPTPAPAPAPSPSRVDQPKGLDDPPRSITDRLGRLPLGEPKVDDDKPVDTTKGFSPSDTSTRAASQARDFAAEGRRVAADARNAANAAREKARIAREQMAPAARKAAGPGAQTIKLDSGAVYTGAVVGGKRQGFGVLTTPNGYRYEGQWDKDGASGIGTSVDANQDRYEGEWRDGDRHGRGVYTWATGQKFEGEYVKSARTGLGVLTSAEGVRDELRWQDGKGVGSGVTVFSNGERYEGQYVDAKFDGYGVYTWPDGQRFEGSYKQDKRSGYGILYMKDGSRKSGLWDGTQLTKPD